MTTNYLEPVQRQRQFFASHQSKNIAFRKQQLLKLKQVIEQNEKLLYEAINLDFGKSEFDTYATELSLVYAEINYFLKNLKSLSKPKNVRTNLANIPGSSYLHKEPLGVCLVIGVWNYPYQLTLLPMIAAMAAGNTCMVKPSELAPHCAEVICKLINDSFPKEYLFAAQLDLSQTTALLEQRFDKIFFTGSAHVAKIISAAAAKNLTPVTLELGGKSPAIVSKHANLKVAAKRIVWGKFLNAGQTCIAPDYVYVHEDVKQELLRHTKEYLNKFNYKEDSEHYTRIISEKHFDRLVGLIDGEKVIYGGDTIREKRFFEPTLLDNITWKDKIMEEEIFGPLLPILSFKNIDDAFNEIVLREKPLAAYLFSDNKHEQQTFLNNVSFGGGCINDTVMHISNKHLPFGGVGNSGIGSYHGKYGFDTFSHTKAVLKRATWGEPNIKYPPYSGSKLNWVKRLLG